VLGASVAAGIEAPIRIYVTENQDGTATLSYKKPSAVFAPYADEGGDPQGDQRGAGRNIRQDRRAGNFRQIALPPTLTL
jgi:uncharacterized protein (DUF302 family)